jgi:hypothetical protein
MRYGLYFVMALVSIILISAGCVGGSAPQKPAMDAANATVDRMLDAVNAGDYAAFTQNFSAPMKSAVDQGRFNAIVANMTETKGKYVSRAPVPTAATQQGYNIFIYDCQFENGKWAVQLTMNASDAWAVEGFYYR